MQLTEEEIKKECIVMMGDKLGPFFHELSYEVSLLYSKWLEYVELFGTISSRIDILNESAPLFFMIVQESLWESILLDISCLTDSPKSAGKSNLSIRRLPLLVEPEIENLITDQITHAIEKSEFCRDWRNRQIAHRDLNLALNEQVEPLKVASRKKVRLALERIAKVLNTVSEHYMKTTIGFDYMSDPRGAKSLLYILDNGIKAEKERRKRIRTGNYIPEDFKKREI